MLNRNSFKKYFFSHGRLEKQYNYKTMNELMQNFVKIMKNQVLC